MSDIPDEFADDIRNGDFEAHDFRDWLDNDAPEDLRDDIYEAMDNGLSMEWAALAADNEGSIDPHDWEHVTIHRGDEGWDVIVSDIEGHTWSVHVESDDVAEDLIWSDLYWHLVDEGIEFDRDIDYSAAE